MGANFTKAFARLKEKMKSLASTTGTMIKSISDDDAHAELTLELAHPTPDDVFYTPPLIDPRTNRTNIDTRPRYVPYDSALLRHGCSGRNITWQYLHAADGAVPPPYNKCLAVDRLLHDHGCRMGVCMPPLSDVEFRRYAFYDWDGLGQPVVQDVVVEEKGGGRKVYVDDDVEEEVATGVVKRETQLLNLSIARVRPYDGAQKSRLHRHRILGTQQEDLSVPRHRLPAEQNEQAPLDTVDQTTFELDAGLALDTIAAPSSAREVRTLQRLDQTTTTAAAAASSPSPFATMEELSNSSSQAGRAGAGIAVLLVLVILSFVVHRSLARKRRRCWSRLNTSMPCRSGGLRVSVTGGDFDEDATLLTDFSSGGGARRLGIGKLRCPAAYRDVVVEVEIDRGGNNEEMV